MEPICWICRDGCPTDKAFCQCSGELKTVHQQCLTTWLQVSSTKRCAFCHHWYSIGYTLKPLRQWRWIPVGEENGGDPTDGLMIRYAIWSLCFFLGIVVGFTYLACRAPRLSVVEVYTLVAVPLFALVLPLVALFAHALNNKIPARFKATNCIYTVFEVPRDPSRSTKSCTTKDS
ncbi:E3-MARCH8-like protein [Saguinine gammaherpesvirus 1]|uniref:E3-MARCH8-like protein n=1 Tax=Saguinine gammaherpesvirus 1 TaxID=2169901 RepID=A0A9Q8QXQ9_9GAMA|nr:E3-MARCH8-like protein [Saguinine gammaherpesvirus 1]